MRGFVSLFVLSLFLGSLLACGPKKVSTSYDEYVWPPPPDPPRIQLRAILYGRADVEAQSDLQRALVGATPDPYLKLRKPFAVAYDSQGRILVTDPGSAALLRFDRQGRALDVLGTKGAVRLKNPLGLEMGRQGTIFVADVGLKQVVAFDPEGKLQAAYGRRGELTNPTDAALSPDGTRLFVADSKAHKIIIFDRESGQLLSSFGERGDQEGKFNFPTSLTFDSDGNLYVVDQINSRVQVLTEEGEFLDSYGELGVGFGNFVRPKDIAVDEVGLIYVTDAAFNNVQLFDTDFTLLTFVGDGGRGPGQFNIASGVAVHGDEFAVVDQLNARVQIFQFLTSKGRE
jgi:DNA-binding beta-propeller fold protein YncE